MAGSADEIAFSIYQWLIDNPAEVVLLHIGTNDINNENPQVIADEINQILNRIDRYEMATNTEIVVILARIINQMGELLNPDITALNVAIQNLADARVVDMNDKIIVVNMEEVFTYTELDMFDKWHPNDYGYFEMAKVWRDAIVNLQLSEKKK